MVSCRPQENTSSRPRNSSKLVCTRSTVLLNQLPNTFERIQIFPDNDQSQPIAPPGHLHKVKTQTSRSSNPTKLVLQDYLEVPHDIPTVSTTRRVVSLSRVADDLRLVTAVTILSTILF